MIYLPTHDPESLLADIKKLIDNGHVKTWSYDDDGDFTHTAEQWAQKAWLRPVLTNQSLELRIVRPKGLSISRALYAVYHGRFIEMVLGHLDTSLTGDARTSALATPPDDVGPGLG